MNIEAIRNKLDFPKENDILLGSFSKSYASLISNPALTFFRKRNEERYTNFISYPNIISNETNIKLDEKNGDLIGELIISLSLNLTNEIKNINLDEIKIKMTYGELEILNYSLFDIKNIYKMFPNFYNKKFHVVNKDEETYYINISVLLNTLLFRANRKINVEIIGIDDTEIYTSVFFDSYVLTKMENDRFENTFYDDHVYQYKVIKCKNNEQVKLLHENNLMIEKILVCGDYINNVVLQDEEFEINLINNSSPYNKYHKLCGDNDNSFFYFSKFPNCRDSNKDFIVSGNLFPSIEKTIKVDGYEDETNTIYIQYINVIKFRDDKLSFGF